MDGRRASSTEDRLPALKKSRSSAVKSCSKGIGSGGEVSTVAAKGVSQQRCCAAGDGRRQLTGEASRNSCTVSSRWKAQSAGIRCPQCRTRHTTAWAHLEFRDECVVVLPLVSCDAFQHLLCRNQVLGTCGSGAASSRIRRRKSPVRLTPATAPGVEEGVDDGEGRNQ